MRALRRGGVEARVRRAARVRGARLRGAAPRGGAGRPVHGWGGVPGYVRRSWGPGWALVGDAGYFKDPITAHGITDALRDAELLADALLAALSGGVPEAVALARYQATRDRLSRRLFDATEAVAGYDWDTERRPGAAAPGQLGDERRGRPPAGRDRRLGAGAQRPVTRPDSVPTRS